MTEIFAIKLCIDCVHRHNSHDPKATSPCALHPDRKLSVARTECKGLEWSESYLAPRPGRAAWGK